MDAEFARKNAAQFERAHDGLQRLGREYIRLIAEDFTASTPGFGNQSPDDTRYIPTGRLRGGLNYTRTPIEATSKGMTAGRGEDGPFSDYGRETMDRITSQLESDRMGGISYLENDVAYGILIVRGEAHHAAAGPRNWPADVRLRQETHFRTAMQNVGASG